MSFYQLMLVTQAQNYALDDYVTFIETCAANGITSVQIREKNLSYDDIIALGLQIKPVLKRHSVALIINDNIELAIALDADGVHLGQSDGCPVEARRRLGRDKWIGVSVDSMEDLARANQAPIDYIGVGAIFPTSNKSDVANIWGLSGLKQMVEASHHPVVAIGGINESNALDVMQTGCHGIAGIGVFHETRCLAKTVRQLSDIIRS